MNTLLSLLERIEACFGVQVCVHDVSGVTYSRASLNLPYRWKSHGCAYCSAAKQCIGVERCMLQKQVVMYRLKRSGAKPFYGVCNMGVCEYIQPVLQEGRLLAVVFASGVAREDAQAARRKLEESLARGGCALAEQTLQSYEAFAQSTFATRAILSFLAELVCEHIRSVAVSYAESGAQPDAYPVEAVSRSQSGTVRAILDYLEGDICGPLTLRDLSSVFFMSEGHLCRLFKREMGLSIMAYVKQVRIRTAARLLLKSDEPVSVIGQRVGLADPNYFCRAFKSVMGVSPTEYRRAHALDQE